jgi:hypothetical protein
VVSKWRIASIAPDNALIPPHRANPAGWNCWEPQGSVLVDLAVERGGNVEGAKGGEVANIGGVKIVGHLNLAVRIAATASSLYAKNLYTFLEILIDKKASVLAMTTRLSRVPCSPATAP